MISVYEIPTSPCLSDMPSLSLSMQVRTLVMKQMMNVNMSK